MKPRPIVHRAISLLFLLLAGCSVSVRAPRPAFSLVEAADRKHLEIEHAYNTTVIHLLGLTWSISGSYLGGSRPPDAAAEAGIYAYELPEAWSLTIREATACRPTTMAQQHLSRALDRIFHATGGMPARGSVSLTVVPAGSQVRRYVVTLRPGRQYALDFTMSCSAGAADDALWVAALLAIHESTHAALSLAGKQPDGDQRERVAIGASACLAWSLANGNADFFKKHPLVGDELTSRFELADEHRSVNGWCNQWLTYMRKINARNTPGHR